MVPSDSSRPAPLLLAPCILPEEARVLSSTPWECLKKGLRPHLGPHRATLLPVCSCFPQLKAELPTGDTHSGNPQPRGGGSFSRRF